MQKNQKKFTLEDMLSVKKAEKPSVQEWENFNAQLKSKMLKSMVEDKAVFSPWVLAKFAAVGLPLLGVLAIFTLNPSRVENISMQSNVEIVQIPKLEVSYYSDTYLTENAVATDYLQDMVQSFSNMDIVYATNDLLAFQNLSF